MRWKLKISPETTVSVELLSQADGVFKFKVGDEIVELSHAKAYPFALESKQVTLSFEAWNAQAWRAVSSMDGRCFSVSPVMEGAGAQANKNEIRTQMPGRVLKVLVKPGEKVQPRQTLLIIEAMKMENEIRAEAEATVQSIEVNAGESVESGALLLKLAS